MFVRLLRPFTELVVAAYAVEFFEEGFFLALLFLGFFLFLVLPFSGEEDSSSVLRQSVHVFPLY